MACLPTAQIAPNALGYPVQRLATDGTIVTQGMPVLRYTINGVPMTITAHESGVLTHHKAPGDTIMPDDELFTVRGERRGKD